VAIFLCFLAALLEGADIVSMGLAAPRVAPQFGFAPGEMSLILTAAIVGLMAGAVIGGRLGDSLGRKRVLLGAFLLLALFSLATAHVASLGSFLVVRFLCGLGLGAALPNLIAIASEAAGPGKRSTAVGLMFCGQPVGGSLLGLFVAAQGNGLDWRLIFWLGGVLPLLLLPILAIALAESHAFKAARSYRESAPSVAATLFGDGRSPITLLLWIAFAFTQIIVYLINNWLPTLMVAKGFAPREAAMISAFENMGAVAGCVLLGMLADRDRLRSLLVLTYLAITASLFGLAIAQGFWPVVAAGVIVGFFAIGGQLILYAIAPAYYATLMRATGVGAAISFGRLGAVGGPLAAGLLLAGGVTPAGVLLIAAPCALLAGAAVTRLVSHYQPSAS
jgi:AAHS family 3-hydroxyphenylpropionic acid transporter